MQLILLHPEVAFRSCPHCLDHLYNEETGELELRRDKQTPRKRDKSCPPPCRTSIGCPKGTPEGSKELTRANWEAWRHYRECKAVGDFPDDPVVKRNAGLIRGVEERVERVHQIELATLGIGRNHGQ